jgi:uncharacterized phage protein (TIGR02220 family)
MLWLKHYSDAANSLKISALIDELGAEGYGFYWLYLELLCSKFDGVSDQICLSFNEVLPKLRLANRRKLQSLLEVLNKLDLIRNKTDGKLIQNNVYILLKLKQKDFKTKLSQCGVDAEKSPIDLRGDLRSKIKEESTENKSEQIDSYKYLGALQDNKTARVSMEYLNNVSGKKYKTKSQHTDEMIDKLVEDGYTLDDIKKVIDIKTQQWKGTDMEKFLRPKTLFAIENFSGYLNEEEKKPFIYDIEAQLREIAERKKNEQRT